MRAERGDSSGPPSSWRHPTPASLALTGPNQSPLPSTESKPTVPHPRPLYVLTSSNPLSRNPNPDTGGLRPLAQGPGLRDGAHDLQAGVGARPAVRQPAGGRALLGLHGASVHKKQVVGSVRPPSCFLRTSEARSQRMSAPPPTNHPLPDQEPTPVTHHFFRLPLPPSSTPHSPPFPPPSTRRSSPRSTPPRTGGTQLSSAPTGSAPPPHPTPPTPQRRAVSPTFRP